MERGLYFLLTPVDPTVLRQVNCLLLGAISLPSCILTSQVRMQTHLCRCYFPLLWRVKSYALSPFQSGFEGETAYVTADYSFDLNGAGKLRVFKGLVRPSHVGKQ